MARPHTLSQSLPSLRRLLQAFWPYIRRQQRLAVGSLAAMLAGVGLKLLEPWPLKWVFDYALPIGDVPNRGLLHSYFTGLSPMAVLAIAAATVVTVSAARALAEYCSSIGFAIVGNRVLAAVRNDLYRHLQRLSLSYHTQARGGDLTVRVVGDVNMLKDVAASAILPLIANIVILAGMAVLMLWLEWRLALVVLAGLPTYWLSTVRMGRRIRDAARQQRAREGEMAAAAAESLAAVKDMQALSLEDVFAERFAGRNAECQKQSVRTARLTSGLERRIDVIGSLATAAVLYFGAEFVLGGSMSPGALLVFLAYLKRSFNPLQDFAKYTGRLAKAAAAGERVLDVLQRTREVNDRPEALPAPQFHGDVAFEDVEFGYRDGRRVLRGASFSVPAGSQVALVGPSGIGKSTLLNLLLRLCDPDSGRVLIDGIDLRSMTLASVRSQFSVVLQDGLLFSATVRDNIAYAAPDATDAEIEAAARLANAHEFIAQLPQGYATMIGERGTTLSHGQRQRLAIARAAVRPTPILILDEPTTGLDEDNERAVVAAMRRLSAGRTTFLVTHDLCLAARADSILYLDRGRVLESGTHAQLMRFDGRYASLFRLQTESSKATEGEVNHVVARRC